MTELFYSYLCTNCDIIMDIRDLIQGRCPRCGSENVYPLSKWVPVMRKPAGVPGRDPAESTAA
jgi:DNA-directed RNA polymerase subunit RPC12/RpoP